MSALSGGCLILEDDVVYPDLPRKKNSPPRINLEASLSPPKRDQWVKVRGTCALDEFYVSVDDDDRTDTLRHLWFVDPESQFLALPGKSVVPTNAVTRAVAAPVALLNQLKSINDGKKHVVEVWVTDGEFEITSTGLRVVQPIASATDGGVDGGSELLPTYYADSYSWLVTPVDCP